MNILSAIRELSAKHDMTFQKIATTEITTPNTFKQIKNLSATVQQLVIVVNAHKKELEHLQNFIC